MLVRSICQVQDSINLRAACHETNEKEAGGGMTSACENAAATCVDVM